MSVPLPPVPPVPPVLRIPMRGYERLVSVNEFILDGVTNPHAGL